MNAGEAVAHREAVEHVHHLEAAELEAVKRRPQWPLQSTGHDFNLLEIYCRTQITRTMADSPPSPADGVTLCAARKLRIALEGISRTGGVEGWALASCIPPTGRMPPISMMPSTRPLPSSAAAPDSPASGTESRRRIALLSDSCAESVERRLSPFCVCGSGTPTSLMSRGALSGASA